MELLFRTVPGYVALSAVFLLGGLHMKKRSSAKELREMVRELAESGDVRAIGPLLEGRELRDRFTRKTATEGLKRLLPLLGPEHHGLLDASELYSLHRLLYFNDTDLVLETLKALKYLGNRSSLWYVEGFTGTYSMPRQINTRLQDAAAETLQHINDRLERQRAGQTLLRAVEGADGRTETLLRPAASQAGQPQDQLLRPTSSDPE
jgi:hypothetical protein